MFNVIIVKDYNALSEEAFQVMKEVVTSKERPVLGLATGSSPIGLYQNMIKDHKENGTSYKNVVTFNLDEYVGLKKNHSQTYYTFMNENLFSGLDINQDNVHIPVGDSSDLKKECEVYEQAMKDYQVDIQLLGIGSNGHIGFNEPGTSFDSLTHIVTLKEKTREDNARFFIPLNEEVPTQAITMGIATIMKSKKVLMVASGEGKADAVARMINGPISEDLPASVLQNHPDVVVIVDEAAASKL